jgi:hypothetical protein
MVYNRIILLTFGNSVCFYRQRLFVKYFHSQIVGEEPVCFSKTTNCIRMHTIIILNFHLL